MCARLAIVSAACLLAASVAAAPRLSPLPAAQWDDAQRSIAVEFAAGGMTSAVATYLHNAVLAEHVLPYSRYIASESSLTPRMRELLALRVAWLARSSYVWAHHAAAARGAGLSGDELQRIARGPDAAGWDPFDAALLRAADEMHVDSFIADATWRSLDATLDTRELMDVAFTIGEIDLIAGTVNALQVEIEAGFPDRPPTDVPYAVAAPRTNERLIGRQPRIAPLEPEQWTSEVRELLDPSGSGRRVANVYRTYANNVPADRLRRRVAEHIRNATTLSDRHRELLILRIGVLCRSEYEWAAHARIGRQVGLTEADLARIVEGPAAAGDPVETALLRATDELFERSDVSDDTWAALDAAFGPKELLDVLVAIGGYRALSAAMNSFGVQLDPGNERFPPELR